jgi:hypothetical protein
MAGRPSVKKLVAQALNEKNVVTPVRMSHGAPPVRLRSVQETFITIQEFDPVTFLGRMMNGEPMEYITVDERGNQIVEYENATLDCRRKAAEFLAAKLIPSLHAHKIIPGTPYEDGEEGSVEDVFRKIVSKAINRSRDAGT